MLYLIMVLHRMIIIFIEMVLISSGNVFNVEDTLVLTHLSPASYYISVEDYNGCTTSSNEVEVIEPELIVADLFIF